MCPLRILSIFDISPRDSQDRGVALGPRHCHQSQASQSISEQSPTSSYASAAMESSVDKEWVSPACLILRVLLTSSPHHTSRLNAQRHPPHYASSGTQKSAAMQAGSSVIVSSAQKREKKGHSKGPGPVLPGRGGGSVTLTLLGPGQPCVIAGSGVIARWKAPHHRHCPGSTRLRLTSSFQHAFRPGLAVRLILCFSCYLFRVDLFSCFSFVSIDSSQRKHCAHTDDTSGTPRPRSISSTH